MEKTEGFARKEAWGMMSQSEQALTRNDDAYGQDFPNAMDARLSKKEIRNAHRRPRADLGKAATIATHASLPFVSGPESVTQEPDLDDKDDSALHVAETATQEQSLPSSGALRMRNEDRSYTEVDPQGMEILQRFKSNEYLRQYLAQRKGFNSSPSFGKIFPRYRSRLPSVESFCPDLSSAFASAFALDRQLDSPNTPCTKAPAQPPVTHTPSQDSQQLEAVSGSLSSPTDQIVQEPAEKDTRQLYERDFPLLSREIPSKRSLKKTLIPFSFPELKH